MENKKRGVITSQREKFSAFIINMQRKGGTVLTQIHKYVLEQIFDIRALDRPMNHISHEHSVSELQ